MQDLLGWDRMSSELLGRRYYIVSETQINQFRAKPTEWCEKIGDETGIGVVGDPLCAL